MPKSVVSGQWSARPGSRQSRAEVVSETLDEQALGGRLRTPTPQREPLRGLVIGVLSAYWLILSAVPELLAVEVRDPFVFGPRTEATTQAGLSLIGVIWDATQPLAIVGEQTVAIGDRVEGWLVEAIGRDSVTFQVDDQREVIKIGETLPPR